MGERRSTQTLSCTPRIYRPATTVHVGHLWYRAGVHRRAAGARSRCRTPLVCAEPKAPCTPALSLRGGFSGTWAAKGVLTPTGRYPEPPKGSPAEKGVLLGRPRRPRPAGKLRHAEESGSYLANLRGLPPVPSATPAGSLSAPTVWCRRRPLSPARSGIDRRSTTENSGFTGPFSDAVDTIDVFAARSPAPHARVCGLMPRIVGRKPFRRSVRSYRGSGGSHSPDAAASPSRGEPGASLPSPGGGYGTDPREIVSRVELPRKYRPHRPRGP